MLITIARFTNPTDAHLAKIHLAAAGMECILTDEYSVGTIPHYSNALGGIKLQVLQEFAEAAKAALDNDLNTSLDDEKYNESDIASKDTNERILKPSTMLTLFSLFCLFIGSAGLILSLLKYLEYKEFEDNGVVTEAQAFPGFYYGESDGGSTKYLLDVAYYVEGKLVGAKVGFSESAVNDFKSGKPVKIKYLRENPQKATEIRPPELMLPIVFSSIPFSIGLIPFVTWRRKKSKL